MLRTISPVDGSVVAERPLANTQQITQAIKQARAAQQQWQAFTLSQRAHICEAAVQYFERNSQQIASEIATQMGRPLVYCAGEIKGLAQRARHMINIAPKALADIKPAQNPGFNTFIRRQPLGVVFTIAPWNYPLLTTVNSLIPALMAGNSVLLKPSQQTPLCGEHFVKAFMQAGVPEHLVQCLFLSHKDSANIVASGDVDFVCFTGSVAGGQHMEQAAAGTFLGLGLELGGKDPAYVRSDADIPYSAEQLVDGAFFNSGQSCCGVERIYVHHSVYDAFVAAFIKHVNSYQLGDPLNPATTLGPMVKPEAANWVRGQIAEAVAAGAKAMIDTSTFPLDDGKGCYLAPQVLLGVDHSMSVMRDESFGPVVGIMKVADDAQALALMNDSQLGLTASIWTQDQDIAITLGEQLQTGTVFMNRCDYLDPALAWTGVKNTGKGQTLSELGYHQLTQAKSFNLKSNL